MGSSSKYEAKSHEELSCQFLQLNGVKKVFVQVQISKAVRAENRAQKLLEESGTLLKGSWGVSSPAFLIQKSARASVFSLLLKNSPTNCVQGKAGCFWDPQPHFTSTPISGKPELHLKLLGMVFNLWSSTNYNGRIMIPAEGYRRKTGLHLDFLCHNSLGTELKWTRDSLGTNCEQILPVL